MTSEPIPNSSTRPPLSPYWSAREAWVPLHRYLDPATRAQELSRTWRTWGLSTEPANRQLAEIGISDFYRAREQRQPWIEWATSPADAVRLVKKCLLAHDQPLPWDVLLPPHERQGFYNTENVWWASRVSGMRAANFIRPIGTQLTNAVIPNRETTLQLGFDFRTARDVDLYYALRRLRVHPGQFDAERLTRCELIARMGAEDRRRAREMSEYLPMPWNRSRLSGPLIDGVPPAKFEPNKPALHAEMLIASNAGPWWPFQDTVVICDRPESIHLDDQQQLHADKGPAVAYRDGWGIHAWHGTQVPADLIEGPEWPSDKILAERNTEIRRVAIERLGWDRFIDQAAMVPVGLPVPDPGNPGQELALYDVPSRVYRAHVRVLLCTNGSTERDGTRRRFGLTVPGHFADPVAAAAWSFGWTREQYAALEHRR